MEKNMALWDRIVRVILAIVFLYLAIQYGGWFWVLGILGIIFIVTSAIGFCPLYKIFGIRTG